MFFRSIYTCYDNHSISLAAIYGAPRYCQVLSIPWLVRITHPTILSSRPFFALPGIFQIIKLACFECRMAFKSNNCFIWLLNCIYCENSKKLFPYSPTTVYFLNDSINTINSSSLITGIFNACALVNFEPADSPATTQSVLADTLPETLAPRDCSDSFA